MNIIIFKYMKNLHYVTFLLLAIGGLNWLLVGLFNWDIGAIFGGMGSAVSRLIYILVGLSAIYQLATHRSYCHICSVKEKSKMMPQEAKS